MVRRVGKWLWAQVLACLHLMAIIGNTIVALCIACWMALQPAPAPAMDVEAVGGHDDEDGPAPDAPSAAAAAPSAAAAPGHELLPLQPAALLDVHAPVLQQDSQVDGEQGMQVGAARDAVVGAVSRADSSISWQPLQQQQQQPLITSGDRSIWRQLAQGHHVIRVSGASGAQMSSSRAMTVVTRMPDVDV